MKRSKVFALMERTWLEATQGWPDTRDVKDAVWSLDDMIRAWLREWPSQEELVEYSQWDFMTVAQDEVMNVFQKELSKEILAGNITEDDLVFAMRVIWRYQRLVQQAHAASPDRRVNDLAWSDNGVSWEHAPKSEVLGFANLWENACGVLLAMEMKGGGRIRITEGTAEKNVTVEFDNGSDLVRWLYDDNRDLRMVALRLLLFHMEDAFLTDHPDQNFRKFFGDAEREFFHLPWPVQSGYLYRAIQLVTDVELAQDAMEDEEA